MNTQKIQCYRHGEIAFKEIADLPKGLKEAKTNIIASGSHGNNHTFKGGKIYLKNESDVVFGYFEAKNTILKHKDHGDKKEGGLKVAELPHGFYQLKKGREIINKEFVKIVD